jgi:hypothetical protein
MPNRSPDASPMDAIYLDYATGALSEPARLLLDTHFAIRPERRPDAGVWEVAGAALFEAETAPVAEDALMKVIARAQGIPNEGRDRPCELPGPLGEVVRQPLGHLDWREAAPGSLVYVMPRWPQARLIRLTEPQRPDWSLGPELSLVLQGDLRLSDGVHRIGDILLFDRAEQPPQPEAGECLYFSVQDSGYSAREVRDTVSRAGGVAGWAWRST